MERVILARHGESTFSVEGLTNGEPDGCGGLTPLGREQAAALGRTLAAERIDLCVTSAFRRTRETADRALAGRDVPRLVVPELNDIRFGSFEGKPLVEYRAWAHGQLPTAETPGGGESRAAAVARFLRGYRVALARPEETILVVGHGLPIRYVLNAHEGRNPEPIAQRVEYATPYRLSADELRAAVERLERWSEAPAWAAAPA